MKVLILEDSPERTRIYRSRYKDHDLYIYSSYQDASVCLKNLSPFDLISLDHDLCEDQSNFRENNGMVTELTGYDLVVDICELAKELKPSSIIIHSRNQPAALRMCQCLSSFGLSSIYEPFFI